MKCKTEMNNKKATTSGHSKERMEKVEIGRNTKLNNEQT